LSVRDTITPFQGRRRGHLTGVERGADRCADIDDHGEQSKPHHPLIGYERGQAARRVVIPSVTRAGDAGARRRGRCARWSRPPVGR
jgi:hypothetical protein